MTKQAMSLLFNLFGSFHSSTYISPDVWRGAIPTNKYTSSTYVGLRHPVIALFSSGSNMSAYVDIAHIGAAYSAIE